MIFKSNFQVAISLVGLFAGLPVTAQPAVEPLAVSPKAPVFVIRGFEVTGDNPLPKGETARVLAPFLRTDASLVTLQKATAALEEALRDKGFSLHRVALPPQEIGELVTLNIVKFTVGKVSVEGVSTYTEANIRASLPELKEGTAPNFRTLSVQTAIANENPGKQIQVGLKEADEIDQIDAKIVVKESKPWNFSAGLSNTGSSSTGSDRLTLTGGYANVLGLDHQFTGAYTTSIERPTDVKQIGLNYRIPLYKLGGVMGLSFTRSDVVGNFGAFSSTGAGQTFGLTYNHYLPPDGGQRSYLLLSLDDKNFEAAQVNGVVVQSSRRSRPLTVGYNSRVEADNAVWGFNVDLGVNLAGGDGNDLTAYKTEDARINTADWRAVRGAGNYLTGFAGGWLWGMRGQFQYTTQALISGEQFGIGGSSSVRGTGERPISGDSGLFLSTEVTTREWVPGLRLLGFIDAGWLSNNNPNGGNKPLSDSIASVGLGLRFASVSGVVVSADYGRLIKGSEVPFVPNSGIPQVGDEKLHLNLSVRF